MSEGSRSGAPAHDMEPTVVRTFLFADIRGYTRFTQEFGDEAAARLAAKFGLIARECLSARDGQIIGLQGDEAVAVFSSARQALRAATELQARFAHESSLDPSLPLLVGVGLDTGEAVRVADDYIGAALNLAARLCKLAGPNEVLASEGVVHVAHKLDGITYAERGLAQLKGFADPVRIIHVLPDADRHSDAAPQVEAPGATPETALPIGAFLGALPSSLLVAREDEMHRLLATIDAVASGSGRLTLLVGEPGVGKTRLVQEVMLSARNRRFLTATGRCYELHQSVPFYPFLDALATAYASCPPAVRAALPRRWPQVGRLLPDVSVEVQQFGAGGPDDQQRLFRAVTGFLQAIAGETPVALLLDDLHWADGASLELLQHLARHTRSDRILLLGTYRNVEVNRRHPLEAALRDLTREELIERIAVRRLEARGTSELIATTLGAPNVSDQLVELIHQRTEGNPFFVQHLLRLLVERGDVYLEAGHWTERALATMEVPESVRSLIGQRLGRLAETTQEILQDASVLGQTFSFEVLSQVAGGSEADLEAAFEEAGSTGLIHEAGTDTYAFDHALTQQALYTELSGRRRRRLHLAAAEALERLPQESRGGLSAELAWHFVEGAQEKRALPYAVAAGDQARAVFANREAERHYTTALDIAAQLGDVAQEAEILARRARVNLGMFHGKAALQDYERLLEGSRKRGDRTQELAAMLGVAEASYVVALDETERDQASRCREMYEAAYALAQDLNDQRAMARALRGTRWFGDFWPDYRERVLANLEEALAISRRIGDEELIIDSELTVWRRRRRAEGEAISTRLAHRLRERGDLQRLNALHFDMLWADFNWGNFQRAAETGVAAIKLADEIGAPPVQYPTLQAFSLLQLGRYGEAWHALQGEVTDEAHPFGQAMQTLGLGMYRLELLDYEEAARVLTDLIRRATRLQRAWMHDWGKRLRARCLLRAGALDAAGLTQIQHELQGVDEERGRAVPAEVLLALGNADEALADAEQAAQAAAARDWTPEVVAALEVQSMALLAMKRPTEALSVAADALRKAEGMGALPMVWRLQVLKTRAHRQLNDHQSATRANAEAARIVRALAASIPDPTDQQRFLASAEVSVLGGVA
ncbi:MAG TPA: AAA family ATPase [Candidatus Dormibacteraeota bacterium]|nr:AAA family ATPase [Candidatus Dormibacteraeota bacterium]